MYTVRVVARIQLARRASVLEVVVPMYFFPQYVETVDLMEDLDLRNIGIVASMPFVWCLDCKIGFFARVCDSSARDCDDLHIFS